MMSPLSYFPFDEDGYKLRFDARPLRSSRRIEVDDAYLTETAQKEDILAGDAGEYRILPCDTESIQWEAVDVLLGDVTGSYPAHFELETSGDERIWMNRLLSMSARFTPDRSETIPLPPLDWMARQLQEDLLLLAEDSRGEIVLAAGHLCFGTMWRLADKIGRPVAEIHDPVPGYADRLARVVDGMLHRLQVDRPTGRAGWSITPTDRLNLNPLLAGDWIPSNGSITVENAVDRCFLRTERQTFSKLPKSGAILMTIRVRRVPVAEVAKDADRRRRLRETLRTLPDDVIDYKSLRPFHAPLLSALDAVDRRSSDGRDHAAPR